MILYIEGDNNLRIIICETSIPGHLRWKAQIWIADADHWDGGYWETLMQQNRFIPVQRWLIEEARLALAQLRESQSKGITNDRCTT